MATMRQAIWEGGTGLALHDVPVPLPGPGQVRVRVHACGVCMTEVHFTEGTVPASSPPPVGFGHEWSGVIDALGGGIADFAVGDPVAGSSRNAFAPYVIVQAEKLVRVPPGASLDAAIFVEPIACCISSVDAAGPGPHRTALITGAGPMGLVVLQLARQAGIRVVVSEPDDGRRARAKALGAEAVVDPRHESVGEAAHAISDGQGVDVAWEAAGRAEPVSQCLEAVRPGGVVVLVGVSGSEASVAIPLFRFHRRQLRLVGVYGAKDFGEFRRAAAALPTLELDPMITNRFPLERIDDAYAVARGGQAGKVLITPT